MPDRRLSRPSRLNSAVLLLARHARPAGVTNGSGSRRADVEPDAGVLRAEVGRAVRPRAAAAVAGRLAEDDVLRQVLVERAQAVADPRADGREGPLADVPAGVQLELGPVVVVGRPQRADHGDVVGARADVLPPVADRQAALAVAAGSRCSGPSARLPAAVARVAGDDVLAAAPG